MNPSLTAVEYVCTERIIPPGEVARYNETMAEMNSPFGTCDEEPVPRLLVIGHVSQVLGCEFPGPGTVVVSMQAYFGPPVRAGKPFQIEIGVTEKMLPHTPIQVAVTVRSEGRRAMTGEVLLIPPSEAAAPQKPSGA